MPTKQEREQIREDTKKLLDELSSVDVNALARTEDIGKTFTFEPAIPDLRQQLDLAKELANRDLSRISHRKLKEIHSGASGILNLIKKVQEFDVGQSDPTTARQALLDKIEQAYDGTFDCFCEALSFTATQQTDFNRLEREARGVLSEMQVRAKTFEAELEKRDQESRKALDILEKQVAEGGASQNAIYFREEADTQKSQAKKWLNATIFLLVVTCAAAIGAIILAFKYTPQTAGAAIQLAISKLLIFSVLSFALIWCTRNFRAHLHNETINTHRQNAISTFRTFVMGSDDPQIRNTILLMAAQAAFSNRSTGFDTADADNSPSIAPIIEVATKALPKTTINSSS